MKANATMRNASLPVLPMIVAALVASLLMLAHGVAHHTLAARLTNPVTITPLTPETLVRLPLRMGDWIGEDVPLDEAIVRRTDTDAYLNRRYSRGSSLESVSLYIACGVKTRDLMPHRPEVCYVGAGWTRTGRGSVDLPLDDGLVLPCNLLYFARGVLNTSRLVVLNYYIVDGQYCRDVSLLRSKAWRGSGLVRYATQVQIVAGVAETSDSDSAAKSAVDFARESASLVFGLFEHLDEEAPLDSSRRKEEGG